MVSRLEKVLRKRFPDEDVFLLADLLLEASLKGMISYEEINFEGKTEELLLLAYRQRMLIPFRTSQVSKSLAWDNRILIFQPQESYEMPLIIRYLVKNAEKTGRWSPFKALKECLTDLGEKKIKQTLKVTRKILRKAKKENYKIVAEQISKFAVEVGVNPSELIRKLKGLGVISPCSRKFLTEGIVYEVNPSMY